MQNNLNMYFRLFFTYSRILDFIVSSGSFVWLWFKEDMVSENHFTSCMTMRSYQPSTFLKYVLFTTYYLPNPFLGSGFWQPYVLLTTVARCNTYAK